MSRLQIQISDLRKLEIEKQGILAQIDQLESRYQAGLNEKESTITEYSVKLDIDSDLLNNLRSDIDLLQQKLKDLFEGLGDLDKEINGLKKAISLAKA